MVAIHVCPYIGNSFKPNYKTMFGFDFVIDKVSISLSLRSYVTSEDGNIMPKHVVFFGNLQVRTLRVTQVSPLVCLTKLIE